MAVVGRNRLHLRPLLTDSDAHPLVGNGIERNHRARAEMADKAGPQPGTVGFDRRVEVEPHGQRRTDIRVLVAGKDHLDILHAHILREFRQDLWEDLNAARVQQHGMAAIDDHVFIRIDDVAILFGIPADDDPLVAVLVVQDFTLHTCALSAAVLRAPARARWLLSWNGFSRPGHPRHG